MPAPVILFVYSRPKHVSEVINALMKNKEAKESSLYIFSDGPKNEKAKRGVEEVREYIRGIKDKNAFKDVTVFESAENKGLANSVISGVSRVIKEHGKAIIIENDAVCAKDFLEFMNSALEFYEKNEKVWFIGGYAPDISVPKDYKHDVFMNGRGSSYAWATWKDRWEKVDWEVSDYNRFKINFLKRHRFNKYGKDRSQMLDAQMHGKIDSWAIRFSYAMFCNNMYAILPVHSRIKCIGNDGSGTHCGNSHQFDVRIEDYRHKIKMENVEPDERIRREHAAFFEMSAYSRLKRYIKTVILKG